MGYFQSLFGGLASSIPRSMAESLVLKGATSAYENRESIEELAQKYQKKEEKEQARAKFKESNIKKEIAKRGNTLVNKAMNAEMEKDLERRRIISWNDSTLNINKYKIGADDGK